MAARGVTDRGQEGARLSIGIQPNHAALNRYAVPHIPNATIERTALASRLDSASECDLILVAAAPGSGKTALLAHWANASDQPMAWLSCDADDADAAWFWRDVIAAIRSAWADVSLGEGELTDDLDSRQLAIEIANELSLSAHPGVIIIDDFHLAQADPAAIVAFIEALPSCVQLVLGTRHDPPFPLGRMRVQGRLLELRQADLRFTDHEIEQALATLGVELGRDDLEHLTNLTEGWAAGVHLAGLSLRAATAPAEVIRRLGETDRSLVDFLMNEVIELQTPEIQDFLIDTGELEAFDAALCDCVTGRSDSREVLEEVRAANLFLVGLDGDSSWYRYHQLFREFLRARLRLVAPHRVPTIHRAAAAAFTERGDLVQAMRHSMSAGSTDEALERLTTHMAIWTTLDDQNIGGRVAQTWLTEHGADDVLAAPHRILACVVALDGAQLTEIADEWLERIEAVEASLGEANRLLLEQARSFHLLYRGDPAGALEHAVRAKEILDSRVIDSIWVPTLPMMFLQAQLWLDDAAGAAATIEAQRHSPHQTPVISAVRMPGFAAQLALLQGDYIAAERLALQAEAGAARIGLPRDAFGMAEPAATLADVAFERGRLVDVEARAEHVLRIVDNGRRPLLEVLGHLLLARLASANGDDVVVAIHLDRARGVLPNATAPVIAHIDRVELRHALDRHDPSAATTLLARLPSSPTTDLLAARVLLATGELGDAEILLQGSIGLATPRLQIEHGVLSALAAGDIDRAHAHLHEALELAQAMGYRRTIVSEGPALWELLRSLPTGIELVQYVDGLLEEAAGAVPPSRVVEQSNLVESLSERELTVLRYLSSRLDGTEIAAALYLSVNTIRSHVKAIYRKLGVNSRADAVRVGRSLGLI